VRVGLNGYPTPAQPVVFRSVGTTTWQVPPGVTSVNVLVVGGGGGGGATGGKCGGGGGAGGFICQAVAVTPGAVLTVTVGGGGANGVNVAGATCGTNVPGCAGGNSVFGSLTAYGGMGGQGFNGAAYQGGIATGATAAQGGGSGGGATQATTYDARASVLPGGLPRCKALRVATRPVDKRA